MNIAPPSLKFGQFYWLSWGRQPMSIVGLLLSLPTVCWRKTLTLSKFASYLLTTYYFLLLKKEEKEDFHLPSADFKKSWNFQLIFRKVVKRKGKNACGTRGRDWVEEPHDLGGPSRRRPPRRWRSSRSCKFTFKGSRLNIHINNIEI